MKSESLKIKTEYYVRQFTDGSGCFLFLGRQDRGIVPFYSSSEAYASTNGNGEGEYYELVRRSVPPTPAQIAGELEKYAAAVKAPQREPVDWPPSGLAWPFRSWRSQSSLWPRVFLADARTATDIAAFSGFGNGTREMHALAQALTVSRGLKAR